MSQEGNRKLNLACRIWHYILKSEKPNLQKWAVSADFYLPTRFCCRRWVRAGRITAIVDNGRVFRIALLFIFIHSCFLFATIPLRRMIVALIESSSPRRLGTSPRMVSKADRSDITVSNDFVKRNLFSISKLIIIWFLGAPACAWRCAGEAGCHRSLGIHGILTAWLNFVPAWERAGAVSIVSTPHALSRCGLRFTCRAAADRADREEEFGRNGWDRVRLC
jgi:hypothetical protein